jgi:hypothetical protein
LIASHSKEIYELKGKIRKHDESILQLERIQFEFRVRYEAKSEPEGTTVDETAGSKRLRRA